MTIEILGVLGALFALYFGAELTLQSSEKIGRSLGLSALAIGVLIIGFGTSLPEFFVSQIAASEGKTQLALGNLIGSNIANSLLILGVASLFAKIPVKGKGLWGQLFFHLFLHSFLLFFLTPPTIQFGAQAFLLVLFVSYIIFSIINDKASIESQVEDDAIISKIQLKDCLFLVLGVGLLFGGGELLVSQGSALGRKLGVSDYLISVIFISFGTSFPELVTSVLACVKKKDISLVLGNILGSNFFNLSFVLGSLIRSKIQVSAHQSFEMKIMVGMSLCFMVFALFKQIPRWISVFLLSGYAYVVYTWVILS